MKKITLLIIFSLLFCNISIAENKWDFVKNDNAIRVEINGENVYGGKFTYALLKENGKCDISNVIDVLSKINPTTPVLIKSTISLEGWDIIQKNYPKHTITFSPEFLRAKTALQDLLNADEMLVGGGDINFWTNLFKKCYNKPINILTMSVEELILIKYFRNSFLATKVSFFNQIYDLCEATGIDYKNVKEGIGMDTRIGNSHTDVNTSRGYGGHCFPKDVQAILETAQANNVDLSLIKQSQQYNNTVRKEI